MKSFKATSELGLFAKTSEENLSALQGAFGNLDGMISMKLKAKPKIGYVDD